MARHVGMAMAAPLRPLGQGSAAAAEEAGRTGPFNLDGSGSLGRRSCASFVGPRGPLERLSPADCTNWIGETKVDIKIKEAFIDEFWGSYQHDLQDLQHAARPTEGKTISENASMMTQGVGAKAKSTEKARTTTEGCTTRNLALTSPRPTRPRCA